MKINIRNIKKQNCGFYLYLRLCGIRRELSHAQAGQWLADNSYLLTTAFSELGEAFRRLSELPCCDKAAPIALAVCRRYLERYPAFDPDGFEAYLKVYQTHRALSENELTALPLFLRFSAVETVFDCATGRKNESAYREAFNLLRLCENYDFGPMLDRLNTVEAEMNKDPSGIYPKTDEAGRSQYRERVRELAENEGKSELQIAQELLIRAENAEEEKKRHIGYGLLDEKESGISCLLLPAFLASAAAIICGAAAGSAFLPFAAFLPLWEVFRPLVHKRLSSGKKQPFDPKLTVAEPIDEQYAVLVTVCCLLPAADKVKQTAEKLEKLCAIMPKGCVYFALLADPCEAKETTSNADFGACSALSSAVRELNHRLEDRFFLRIRPRVYCQTQRRYAPRERKRGAVEELCELIRNPQKPADGVFCGNLEKLAKVKYLLLLDSDTQPELDSLPKLLGSAEHILNRPEETEGKVTDGYGIFAPKITTSLESAYKTVFSYLFCPSAGVSSYDGGTSELYQQLYGSSIFCGKGLVDVKLYNSLCKNLPSEQILSHDIIEGCILRCRFVGDSEFVDEMPSTPASWLRRRHRWIRGDLQNLAFLSDCRINPEDKFKLADNLRRALTPLAAVICLIAAQLTISAAKSRMLTAIGLAAALSDRLYKLIDTVKLIAVTLLSGRAYCGLLKTVATQAAAIAAELIMLVPTAFSDADAVIRAAWRMLISRKNLLEWTTSEQSNGQSIKPITRFAYTAAGILLLRGSRPVFSLLCAATALLPLLSLPLKSNIRPRLSDGFAAAQARLIWNFFSRFCGAEDNFLPPDNVQFSPVYAVAHRTSPTNIGLYICSAISAFDFAFIGLEELITRLEATFETVDRLPKYRGHLYNWYDTKTLATLRPEYVSSVDSGNFLCCLTAAEGFLRTRFDEDERIGGLLAKISKLRSQTDLSFLFDRRRSLFSIGRNTEKAEADKMYYDLLMSEARLMGYYAISTGQADRRHWRSLGRIMGQKRGRCGPLSWNGSMFEYLMPYLFLPVFRGSADEQALRFCLSCQKNKRFGGRGRRVWGVSESGFYSFDRNLDYRYKSNGVNALSIRKCDENDAVVSPYSSFLALPFSPAAARENLEKLDGYGMCGEYGYYEALDFSPGRTGSSPKPVRSCMAHHLAMSMLSLDNCAHDFVWQQRFMSDEKIASAVELLKERPPEAVATYNKRPEPELKLAAHSRQPAHETLHKRINAAKPLCNLLTNGAITLVTCDSGSGYAIFSDLLLTEHSGDIIRRPRGFFALLRSKNRVYEVTASPGYSQAGRSVKFTDSATEYSLFDSAISAVYKQSLHANLPVIELELTAKTSDRGAEYLISLFPALCSQKELESHYAYKKLFITSRFSQQSAAVIMSTEHAAIAVGTSDGGEFEYTTDLGGVLTRPLGVASLTQAFEADFSAKGCCADSGLFVRGKIGREGVKLLVAAGQNEAEAENNLRKARAKSGKPTPCTESMLQPANAALGNLVFGDCNAKSIRAAGENCLRLDGLWRYSISGDHPLYLIETDDGRQVSPYFELFRFLLVSGIKLDMAVIFTEDAQYLGAAESRLREAAEDTDVAEFIDRSPGLHFINSSELDENRRNLLTAAASVIAESVPADKKKQNKVPMYAPIKVHSVGRGKNDAGFTENSYVCGENERLPQCVVLANPSFGALLSDKSLGFTWAHNSQLCKLTPFSARSWEDNTGERLLCRLNGRYYDMLDGSRAEFFADKAVYRCEFEGVSAEITVSVPTAGQIKLIEVRLSGGEKPLELAYYCEPVLSVDRRFSRFNKAEWDGALTVTNTLRGSGYMRVGALEGCDGFTCDRRGFWKGRIHDNILSPCADSCAAVVKKAKSGESVTFYMAFSNEKEGLAAQIAACREKRQDNHTVICGTGTNTDTLFNVFLPMQIRDCRMYGRTGFYQNGGAWGFRDQLQDAAAAVYFAPEAAKYQILRAAAVCFEQGDALHWWHSKNGRPVGIRSRYSDDPLWLCAAVTQYCNVTDDYGILDTLLPFLDAEPLGENERQRYFEPAKSERRATLHSHILTCLNAANKLGRHGLCLFYGGDWNDGFNRVGENGLGESVWLTMFAVKTLTDYAAVCRKIGCDGDAQRLEKNAEELRGAAEKCWEDDRYIRGYFDSGRRLGSKSSAGCKLDVTVQAFGVIAQIGSRERMEKAAQTVLNTLYDGETGILRLFDPPFDKSESKSVGYTAQYPTGVRENGGQYTHGAVWFAYALFLLEQPDAAWKLLCGLNPRLCGELKNAAFHAEPYLIPADIRTNPDSYGEAGWNLYTGAAGWFYRTVIEAMLGIKTEGGRITVCPRIPECFNDITLSITLLSRPMRLRFYRAQGAQRETVIPDGASECGIPFC